MGYDVPFDAMTNCLAARSAQNYAVTPQIYQAQGIAYVTLAAKTVDSVQAEYIVRRMTDQRSQVDWRRRQLVGNDIGGMEADARSVADRCGRMG